MDPYTESAVRRLLAEDDRISDLSIRVVRQRDCLVLSGEVETVHRRSQIELVIAEMFPGIRLENDIGVSHTHAPPDVEELR